MIIQLRLSFRPELQSITFPLNLLTEPSDLNVFYIFNPVDAFGVYATPHVQGLIENSVEKLTIQAWLNMLGI